MQFTSRQIEIIESATELIGEKGIQNLTTKNLAMKMGFSEPALYRHFNGKVVILKAVLEYYKLQMSQNLQSVLKQSFSGREKIEALLKFQFSHFSKYPAIVMVIFSETSFQFDKSLSEAVSGILSKKKDFVEQIISDGQEDLSIRNDVPAEQLASIIMGSMRFTVLKWRLDAYKSNLKKEGSKLNDTIKILIKT